MLLYAISTFSIGSKACIEGMKLHTARPTTNQAGPKELTAEIRSHAGDWIPFQERVKFGDELEQIAERKEAAVQGPGRPGASIAFAAEECDSLTDELLPWISSGVDTSHGRLRDSILEAKAIDKMSAVEGPRDDS